MKIMTATRKFIITDTKQLISPKGYDHTQPVYIETEVAIHCDEIPPIHMLPKGKKLYIHDIEKITKQ